MKRTLQSIVLLTLLTVAALTGQAQVKVNGNDAGSFQVGAFGGVSVPLGTYKSIGETKNGYFGGLFLDQYFKGNKFGLGLDARYLQHGIRTADSIFFSNGNIGTGYFNPTRFQNWAVTLGPSFQFGQNRFRLEAYLRGGVLMQQFPRYETTLTYTDANSTYTVPIKRTTNDSTNRANAWAGLGGLRFNYHITPNLAVFAQVDYMQSFGSKFGGKASHFQVEERMGTGTPIGERPIKGFTDHYEEQFTARKTPYQSVNAGVGVKYVFGKRNPKIPVEKVTEAKALPKAIQIVVKDKQTGLALSGVTVSIKSDDQDSRSTTNAEGEAERVQAAEPMPYTIVGEKNGIKTNLLTLSPADFQGKETIIYREIFHDDPRFTLIGETVDCDLNQVLPNIATVLTQSSTRSNANQTSDMEGKFIYQLEQNQAYSIVANQAGKYSQTEIVSTQGLDRSKTLYVTLKLGVCNLIEGGNWVLKNIHYDFDKSNIRPDAAIILDNVLAILKQNPTLSIELSSHTDSRGNDAYNMRLSQQRAESAVNYLVKNGIDRSRLVAAGYGETRLLNDCGNGVNCSEAQHQENRRTEIKVLRFQN